MSCKKVRCLSASFFIIVIKKNDEGDVGYNMNIIMMHIKINVGGEKNDIFSARM